MSICATAWLLTSGGGAADANQPVGISETIIVVGRPADEDATSFESRHQLDEASISDLRASSLDEAIEHLPSAHVPINSRGESILFLRNAAERQVAIFYEGAALNVPWDNRLDLSLFPAGLVGSLQSAAGPLAPHYGVNALGAVNLMPPKSRGMDLAVMAGEGARRDVRGKVSLVLPGNGGVQIGGSYVRESGEPLADRSRLPFSQQDAELRTNTDRRLVSAFGRAHGKWNGHRVSFTVLHIDGEKGIAPESDRPTGARFWRYPQIDHTLAVAALHSPLGPSTTLDSSVWFQTFGQTIDAHADASYTRRSAREVNRDRTFGARTLLAHDTGPWRLVASANFLESAHDQQDIAFAAGNLPAALPPVFRYEQRNWSLGGEIEWHITPQVIAEIGFGHDQVDFLKTGDKPKQNGFTGWTGRAGVIWTPHPDWTLRAAVARKMRSPTMRELFGQALNRFLLNPDLEAEKIVTAEAGVDWRGIKGNAYVIPFYQHLTNTIDQRNVGPLRQRINLVGSRVAGVEVGGRYEIAGGLYAYGNANYAVARRRGVTPGQTRELAEKPELLARAGLAYMHRSGLRTSVEVEHVGRAFSADASGVLVLLARSTSLNLRMAYRFALARGHGEIFLNAENATNAYVEPQIGLPAPGRWVRCGFSVQM